MRDNMQVETTLASFQPFKFNRVGNRSERSPDKGPLGDTPEFQAKRRDAAFQTPFETV